MLLNQVVVSVALFRMFVVYAAGDKAIWSEQALYCICFTFHSVMDILRVQVGASTAYGDQPSLRNCVYVQLLPV